MIRIGEENPQHFYFGYGQRSIFVCHVMQYDLLYVTWWIVTLVGIQKSHSFYSLFVYAMSDRKVA
jgi:hypothetical protein